MKRRFPDESPARGSKPRQAPAARKPARGRTAPLEARFRAAAAESDVLVRLTLGPERASSLQARAELLADDYIAATRVFDRLQDPHYAGAEDLQVLLADAAPHFGLFNAIGGHPSAVAHEYTRLKNVIAGDDTLRNLTLPELFCRLFVHFVDEHANVLLLVAVWHAAAMDVRLGRRASILRSLRHDDQDHWRDMLFYLVSCAWQVIGEEMDVSHLPVKDIVTAWHRKVVHMVGTG